MIASLKGLLAKKSPDGIVIETGGIGYDVLVPLSILYQLPDPGATVQLMIHTHIRENQVLLIGFLSHEERQVFRSLTTVSGIGPRLAVNILAGMPSDQLLEAIVQQDAQRLQKIPGVGKKMAERMVVELKDKLPQREMSIGQKTPLPPGYRQYYSEALSALMNLGYKRKEADNAISAILIKENHQEITSLESLLKATLRQLSKDG